MSSRYRALKVCLLAIAVATSAAAEERTWRGADELTEAELGRANLAAPGPRDETGYLPAERYPFKAPYDAEEIGYRLMEFNHVANWAHMLADVFGSVTKEGYLTEGISVGMIDSGKEPGAAARIYGAPGETYQRWNYFYTYPPKDDGLQQTWHLRRTGPEASTKLDYFVYTPGLRRVRRQPPPRRDAQFPDSVQSFDDIVGLEAWEFEWKLLGADTLYRTVRFPRTRPTIILARSDGSFFEQNTADIKMMGDEYPYYREDGGVDTFVVQATPREDWLPTYRIAKIIYWVDQYYFYPLRIEQYDDKGSLRTIQVRVGQLQNPNVPEGFGYTNPHSVYWDLDLDLITFSAHDAMTLQEWTTEEQETVFNPDFMRRRWLRAGAKSQVLVRDPAKFHLRPEVLAGRFPEHRQISLPPDIQARVDAQNAAGRLVFSGGDSEPAGQPTE